jgi:RING finger protein 113A
VWALFLYDVMDRCAIDRFIKSPKCYACGAATSGIFNKAEKILAKLEAKNKAKREAKGIVDEENTGDGGIEFGGGGDGEEEQGGEGEVAAAGDGEDED